MITIVLIVLAIVLIAQAVAVILVRRSGHERVLEAGRYGRDVGIEDAMTAVCGTLRDRGWRAREIEHVMDDAIDLMIAVGQSTTDD